MSFVIEYYSVCCDAPPLYNISSDPEYGDILFSESKFGLGVCMCCRKSSYFNWEVGKDE